MNQGHAVILGGGIVGLSVAWELLRRHWRVTVVDHDQPRNTSWASAGVLLPTSEISVHPIDRLCCLGTRLHREWSVRLHEQTGIDNELLFGGGLYVARSPGEAAALIGQEGVWHDEQIEFEPLDSRSGLSRFPELGWSAIRRATWVPSEGQLRTPRHLRALRQALLAYGEKGSLVVGHQVDLESVVGGRELAVRADGKLVRGDLLCMAAGAWSGELLSRFGVNLPTTPVRGQILLFKTGGNWAANCVINEGVRYLVPRADGHLLVGSTMEEVGFDCRTTEEGVRELREFAVAILPRLASAELLDAWAGLRPASFDGLPYLGKIEGLDQAYIATGLFRIGVQASPAVAVAMADLMEGRPPPFDLMPFAPTRVLT